MMNVGVSWTGWTGKLLYGLLFFALAVIARTALEPYLESSAPFITFFPAVFAAATLGGFGSGILVTLLCTFYALGSVAGIDFSDPASVTPELIFVLTGLFTSWVCERYQRSQRRLFQMRDQVERELRHALQEVKETDEHYRHLFEGVIGSVIIFQPVRKDSGTLVDFIIKNANPEVLRRLELKPEAFINRSAVQVFGPRNVRPYLARAQQVLESGVGQQFEARFTYNNRDLLISMFRVGAGLLGVVAIDVTENKRQQERLRLELANTLNSVGDMIYSLDQNWRFTVVNRHTENIFRMSQQELLSKTLWEVYPGGRNSEKVRHFQRAMTERVPVHFEVESMLSPGRWLDVRVYPAEDGGISVFAGDITERRRAREALQRSERRWRGTFDAAPVPIWELDFNQTLIALKELKAQGVHDLRKYFEEHQAKVISLASSVRIIEVNQTSANFFALHRTDLSALNLTDYFHERSLPVFADMLVALSGGESSFFAELPVKGRGRSVLTVHMFVSVMPGFEEDLSRVLISFVDVTTLRKTQEALRITEERFRMATEAMRGLVYEWNLESGAFSRSRGLTDLLGYQPNEVPPTRDWWMRQIHPDDLRKVEAQSFRAIEEMAPLLMLEYRIRNKEGSYFWIWDNCRVVYAPEGRPVRWVGCCVSIEGHKRAEEDLRNAHARLARANDELEVRVAERTAMMRNALEELESFSYSLSHDMRAPLRAIQGFTRAVIDEVGPDLPEEHQEYLARVESSAERLQKLILEVLSYSRISRAQVEIQPVNVDRLVNDLLRERTDLQAPKAKIMVHGPLQPMLGDKSSLTQCLMNLLGNAVKYVAPGKLPEVTIWTESCGDNVRLYVRDNGIGIENESLPKLFGLFQRARNSKGYEGSGLGLAIVKKAAERMSGRVGVESQPGHGSTFWIELPVALASEVAAISVSLDGYIGRVLKPSKPSLMPAFLTAQSVAGQPAGSETDISGGNSRDGSGDGNGGGNGNGQHPTHENGAHSPSEMAQDRCE